MHVNRSKAEAAAITLDIDLEGLTAAIVSTAYRAAAAAAHPDAGGTALGFTVVQEAKATLMAWLEALERVRGPALPQGGTCRACQGKGRIRRTTGFGTQGLTLMCVLCDGTGNAKKHDRDE